MADEYEGLEPNLKKKSLEQYYSKKLRFFKNQLIDCIGWRLI